MKRWILIFLIPLNLFAEGQQGVQSPKVNEDMADIQKRLRRVDENLLPKSGGDDVFSIDRKDNQVSISTLTINNSFTVSTVTISGSTTISSDTIKLNSNAFTYKPWTSYTPSFSSGWGTPVGIIAFYKIVGDTMEVRGSFGTGTVAASAGTITLPTGYVIDESKDAGMGQSYYGLIFNHQTTAAAIFSADKAGVLTQTTGGVNDRLTFSGRVENNGWQASAINAFFINGDYVSFYASFPVTKT